MPNKPRGDSPSEKGWYYLLNNETHGPVPAAQLRRLLQSGDLEPDTLVWCQGMKDWVPARSFKAGAAQRPLAAPPKTPGSAAASSLPQGRLHPGPLTLAEDAPAAKSPRPTRRLPWVVVGALGAMAILLCGVGIGYVLRESAGDAGGDRREVAQQPSVPAAPVVQPQPPVATEPSAPAAGTRSTSPATAYRTPVAGSSDAGPSAPDTAPSRPRTEPSPWAGDRPTPDTTPAQTPGRSGVSTDPAPAGEPTTLYHVIDFQCRSSNGVQGITMAQERQFQILTRLTFEPRQPNSSRTVRQQVEQVRLGTADALSRATYEAELNKLVGQQYSFTLNERDEITAFTGFQSTTATSPIESPQQSGFLVATVIDEDGWRELMERSFLRPPDTAADRAWHRSVNHRWGPLGYWRGITTYTPRGAEGYATRYDFTSEMSYVPPEPTTGSLQFDLADANFQPVQSTGYFVFDAQRGHVISVHEVFHVQGTVTAGLMGSSVQLQVEEHQEFSIQISDQNPWQQN